MQGAPDPLTVTLTGELPFLLLAAAVLTWPVSAAILASYRRAVRRTMRTSAAPGRPATVAVEPAVSTAAASPAQLLVDREPWGDASPAARDLLDALATHPWRAAGAYAAAGAVYAAVLTSGWLLATGLEPFPIRTSVVFWNYFWPVVLTTNIVAASTRRSKTLTAAAYFAVLAGLAAAGALRTDASAWTSAFGYWALENLPPTLLLALTLSRRIRAIGPLTLSFLVLSLLGADLAVTVAGSSDDTLRTLADLSLRLGIGAVGALLLVVAIGFVLFSALGWLVLGWIRRSYERKRISDESVTITALWLLFTVVHSVDLVFQGPLWALSGAVAFLAFRTIARASWRWIRPRPGTEGPRLLLLRSFAIGRDAERLLDSVEKHWRRTGPIQMIGADDLASRTIEPHELLDFVSGRVARRFIGSPEALARRLAERDVLPDADGRYRVNDFYCYADTWKAVVVRLVSDSDVVLMDLRTFSRANAGCVYEIGELVHLVPLGRVVFLVDGRTDEAFLREVLERAVRQAPEDSPARRSAASPARLFRSTGLTGGELRELLRALAEASTLIPRR